MKTQIISSLATGGSQRRRRTGGHEISAPETSPKIAATRAADRVGVGSTVMPRQQRADLLNILDGYLVGRPVVELGRARALLRRDRLCALRACRRFEQIRRDTRGPEGVAIGRLSGRGPLGGQFDRHAIQADAEITRV